MCQDIGVSSLPAEFVGADVGDAGFGPVGLGDEGALVVEELDRRSPVDDVGKLAGIAAADHEVDSSGPDRPVGADGGGADTVDGVLAAPR